MHRKVSRSRSEENENRKGPGGKIGQRVEELCDRLGLVAAPAPLWNERPAGSLA